MRYLALAGLLLSLTCAAGAPAQEKKKDPAKDKDKESLITEIGGKTLEEWIKEINHKDPGRRATAISTGLLFGPDRAYQAMPAILEQLGKLGGVDVSVRVNGATAIGLILGSAKDPELKHVQQGTRILVRYLTDSQIIVKYRAVQALGRIGDEAKDAIPNILPLMKEATSAETRQAAAITLGQLAVDKAKIKGPPLNVLQALFTGLTDASAQVRLASIQSLTWLGAPQDLKAQQALLNSLHPVAVKDAEPSVRIWAHMAIMSITHEITTDHTAPIIKLIDHPDAPVRLQAAQAIGTIGPKAKAGIPALMNHLTDKEPAVIMLCIWALGRMEDNATIAVSKLDKIMKDMEQPEPLRDAAKEAIKQISGKKDKK
jgi:hypothetical protein